MNSLQNKGNAKSERASSCGRHPATSAMHSEPAKYHLHGEPEALPLIQKYRPQTENASPSMIGSE